MRQLLVKLLRRFPIYDSALSIKLRRMYHLWAHMGDRCLADFEMAYLFETDLTRGIKDFRRVFDWFPEGSPEWCRVGAMYLNALLEADKRDEFERVFKRYFAVKQAAEEIHHYFRLSEEALRLGVQDPRIERSANVFRRIKENHVRDSFYSFVKGKTVAVVGNGPSELGKGLGKEIDGHDVVIRINNHSLLGHEIDYGCRTDIWAKAMLSYTNHVINADEGISYVMYAFDLDRARVESEYINAMDVDLKDLCVDYTDRFQRAAVTAVLFGHPTTGGLLIDMLCRAAPKGVDVYGFSFVEGLAGSYVHFNNDVSAEVLGKELKGHPHLNKEMAYLKTLLVEGRRIRTGLPRLAQGARR